jgi:hypothetical protein
MQWWRAMTPCEPVSSARKRLRFRIIDSHRHPFKLPAVDLTRQGKAEQEMECSGGSKPELNRPFC